MKRILQHMNGYYKYMNAATDKYFFGISYIICYYLV